MSGMMRSKSSPPAASSKTRYLHKATWEGGGRTRRHWHRTFAPGNSPPLFFHVPLLEPFRSLLVSGSRAMMAWWPGSHIAVTAGTPVGATGGSDPGPPHVLAEDVDHGEDRQLALLRGASSRELGGRLLEVRKFAARVEPSLGNGQENRHDRVDVLVRRDAVTKPAPCGTHTLSRTRDPFFALEALTSSSA